MSLEVLHFTPMETQVLDVLRSRSEDWYADCLEHGWNGNLQLSATAMAKRGRKMFHSQWGGVTRYTQSGMRYYPVLNRFLGRLTNKDMVERVDTEMAEWYDRTFGYWRLSPEGWKFLGLPPMPPGTPLAYYTN